MISEQLKNALIKYFTYAEMGDADQYEILKKNLLDAISNEPANDAGLRITNPGQNTSKSFNATITPNAQELYNKIGT